MAAEPAPVLGAAASAAVDRFPRATRIAGAVGAALRELGLSKHESASASASLLEFTKELFLDEWMSQIEEGEDSEVVLAEGKEEFGRCLVPAKRVMVAA